MMTIAKSQPTCKCCVEARVKTGLEPRPLYEFQIKEFGKPDFLRHNYPVSVCEYCDGDSYSLIEYKLKKS